MPVLMFLQWFGILAVGFKLTTNCKVTGKQTPTETYSLNSLNYDTILIILKFVLCLGGLL